MVSTALTKYWEKRLVREASLYPSLRYLNLKQFAIGKPHTIIRYNTTYRSDEIKCRTKLHLITGTYILQAQRSKFNHLEVNPLCLLCKENPENREHVLTSSKALEGHRSIYTEQLLEVLSEVSHSTATKIMDSTEDLTQLILDCTSDIITSNAPLPRDIACRIEQITHSFTRSISHTDACLLSSPQCNDAPATSKSKVTNPEYPLFQQRLWIESGAPEQWGGRPRQVK